MKKFTYREMTLSSSQLEVPRETYQRNFNVNRAKRIAEEFDERIANEPKVSYRDGKYFVFDGQHTIAARLIYELGDGKVARNRCEGADCQSFFGVASGASVL